MAEERVRENFTYVLGCYDAAKLEGNSFLKWLFGATVGGLGLTGTLVQAGYLPFAAGSFFAAAWSALRAIKLLACLRSQELIPPGNSAIILKAERDKGTSVLSIRWRDIQGLSDAATKNNKKAVALAIGVDKAKEGLAYLPIAFLTGCMVGWIATLFGLKP